MASPRVRKIADRIQVIVAEMLERRVKDPRLGFVTITDVRRHRRHPAGHGLLHRARRGRGARGHGRGAGVAKGLIRSEVGKQLGMRHTPSLDVHPRRAAGDRPPHRGPARQGARAPTRRSPPGAGATYAGEPDPYKKPRDDDGRRDDRSSDDE